MRRGIGREAGRKMIRVARSQMVTGDCKLNHQANIALETWQRFQRVEQQQLREGCERFNEEREFDKSNPRQCNYDTTLADYLQKKKFVNYFAIVSTEFLTEHLIKLQFMKWQCTLDTHYLHEKLPRFFKKMKMKKNNISTAAYISLIHTYRFCENFQPRIHTSITMA